MSKPIWKYTTLPEYDFGRRDVARRAFTLEYFLETKKWKNPLNPQRICQKYLMNNPDTQRILPEYLWSNPEVQRRAGKLHYLLKEKMVREPALRRAKAQRNLELLLKTPPIPEGFHKITSPLAKLWKSFVADIKDTWLAIQNLSK